MRFIREWSERLSFADASRMLNRRQVTTLQGLRELRSLTPVSPVTLQIQREGRLMYVSFTLE